MGNMFAAQAFIQPYEQLPALPCSSMAFASHLSLRSGTESLNTSEILCARFIRSRPVLSGHLLQLAFSLAAMERSSCPCRAVLSFWKGRRRSIWQHARMQVHWSVKTRSCTIFECPHSSWLLKKGVSALWQACRTAIALAIAGKAKEGTDGGSEAGAGRVRCKPRRCSTLAEDT